MVNIHIQRSLELRTRCLSDEYFISHLSMLVKFFKNVFILSQWNNSAHENLIGKRSVNLA